MTGRLPRALLVAVCMLLFASTVAIAASLAVSSARLATFTRIHGGPITCSLEPSADAHVAEDSPLTNYGAGLVVEVQANSGATRRALLRFDLALCSPAIPADAIVHSASLRMTLTADAVDTRTYDLHRVTTTWNEVTVDWNNQPGIDASQVSSIGVSAGTPAATLLEWNVVANVQDFVSGGASNDGWRIGDSSEATASSGLQLHAREAASDRPQLVITYGD